MPSERPSHNRSFRFDIKKGGGIIVILAVLALAINALLVQRGRALPQQVVHLAQEVVETSLPGLQVVTEPGSPAVVPSVEPTAGITATPFPTLPPTVATNPGYTSWNGADGVFDYYVLALSWEPAFCETKPDKVECVTQSAGRYDTANFVLHGLWPNVSEDRDHTFNYCDLSPDLIRRDQAGEWCELPDLGLPEPVWQDLSVYMPGAASCLHHHEWYKHGVCAAMSPEAYYALSNRLVALFAETDFNRVVADHIGTEISRSELLAQFDAEFGPGASDNLSLRCDDVGGTSLLTEIYVVLQKDLSAPDDLGRLFPDQRVSPQGNCPRQFQIDAVGSGGY